MDVLKPPVIYIDGRCYRVNNTDYDNCDTKQSGSDWDDHPSAYGYSECTVDEPCDEADEFEITTTENGRFKTIFHVARTFYAPIIGVRGQTRRRLEDETKALVFVPKKPYDNEIVITGPTRSSVAAARRRVNLIVMSYRRKHEATHFISIPMVGRNMKAGFLEFKEQVLESHQARGIDESIFQNANRLHMTLCTMALVDKVERDDASQILEQCKKDIIDPLLEHKPLKLKLAGIEYMNDAPAEVDVLYARVHLSQGNDVLQTLADNIVEYFVDAGLMDKQYDKVKLHVTIMNTLFRDTKSSGREDVKGKEKKIRQTFNAIPILEKFRDFVFGEDVVDTIHLSQRLTYSSKTGYYQDTYSITLSMN